MSTSNESNSWDAIADWETLNRFLKVNMYFVLYTWDFNLNDNYSYTYLKSKKYISQMY